MRHDAVPPPAPTPVDRTGRVDPGPRPKWDAYLDQVARGVADGIVVYDAECRVVYANPAAERIFGMSQEQLVGRPCDDPLWSGVSPDGRSPKREELACAQALLMGRTVRSHERALTRPDGTTLTLLVSTSPFRSADGEIIGVTNSFADITELKRTEASMRETEEYSKALLQVYARLGQANSYSEILEALRPGIRETLGYQSIWLQLVRANGRELLTMYAGGTAEQSMRALMAMDERLRTTIGSDEFLLLPVTDDPYLSSVIDARVIDVLGDAQTDPITNQQVNKEIVHKAGNRTIVAVPLMLAEEKLGCLSMGTFFDEGVLVPNQRQIDWLAALSNHVAVAMDRVRFLAEREEAQQALETVCGQLEGMLDGVVSALGSAASLRDPYTAQHQERVARLACAIARELGLDSDLIDGLRMAALLHDIGKIAVPTEILSKPVPLSSMEMGIVRGHSELACQLLEHVEFTRPVSMIVRQHHERLDGSGYPDGITGDEMLPESKILAVADVVEAMSSDRPYRSALGIDAALIEIEAHAGVTYDAEAVAACARVVRARGRLP